MSFFILSLILLIAALQLLFKFVIKVNSLTHIIAILILVLVYLGLTRNFYYPEIESIFFRSSNQIVKKESAVAPTQSHYSPSSPKEDNAKQLSGNVSTPPEMQVNL